MSLQQGVFLPPLLPFVTTYGQLGPFLDMRTLAAGGVTSTTWPAIRRVVYMPLWLPADCLTSTFWWVNGAAVSGNVDCGIYSASAGMPASRLARTTSTAQSGTSAIQSVSVAVALPRGQYFIALSLDNTTGTITRAASGAGTPGQRSGGLCEETPGSFGVPSTAGATVSTADRLWLCGFSTVALV